MAQHVAVSYQDWFSFKGFTILDDTHGAPMTAIQWPILGVGIYLLSKPLLVWFFAIISSVGSWRAVVKALAVAKSPRALLCDHDGLLWSDAGLGFWSYLFYLSKYYEFVDTLILLVKQRKVSLLQTYHHAGAVVLMWMLVTAKAPGSFIFVCFNSVIHSFMYAYYAVTALKIKLPFKRAVTVGQLTQFFVGQAIGFPHLFMEKGIDGETFCETQAQRFAVSGAQIYVGFLVILFLDFYKSTYGVRKRKTASKFD